ncbi:MAG TPA: formate/nitrite transporter family protein [Methanocella sp.]|uniref:formate/nitrite transporter family protein n=1 Tax=Methanocella sp. TaxID=2052833 RepID=UPI002C15CBB3|nr:formate/nitrite transporter family protein [Methanocella sp.]HTY91761.1 formate/nitrite transporter family protein [Methanocella sp.]
MAIKAPLDICKAASTAGCTKCSIWVDKLLLLGFLAGAYIAFGALLSEIVAGGMLSGGMIGDAAVKMPPGLLKFAAGAVFPVGLMLVVIAGSELFTGNCMFLPIGVLNKEGTWTGLAINWIVVYIGNLIGALFVAYFLAYQAGLFNAAPFAVWATANVANAKAGLDFWTAFLRGIGCNWLVCLAVWLALSADDAIGKIFSCWFPIMAFVTIGFEHSVANMFFIPLGIFIANDPKIVATAGLTAAQTSNLVGTHGWYNFFVTNLIPVTLGNIVGGAIFVSLIYWWIYLRSPLVKVKVGEAPKAVPTAK